MKKTKFKILNLESLTIECLLIENLKTLNLVFGFLKLKSIYKSSVWTIWHFGIYQTLSTRLFCKLNYLAYVAFWTIWNGTYGYFELWEVWLIYMCVYITIHNIWARWVVEIMKIGELILIVSVVKILFENQIHT